MYVTGPNVIREVTGEDITSAELGGARVQEQAGNIQAVVANLRTVEWRSLGINFVMVFSPNTLAGAPHSLTATIEMSAAHEGAVSRALLAAFPSASIIAVRKRRAASWACGPISFSARAMRSVCRPASFMASCSPFGVT